MSSGEFAYWRAYYRRNPFGPFRDNWNIAQVGVLVAKLANPKSRIKVSDLMWPDVVARAADRTRHTLTAFMAMAKKKDE